MVEPPPPPKQQPGEASFEGQEPTLSGRLEAPCPSSSDGAAAENGPQQKAEASRLGTPPCSPAQQATQEPERDTQTGYAGGLEACHLPSAPTTESAEEGPSNQALPVGEGPTVFPGKERLHATPDTPALDWDLMD